MEQKLVLMVWTDTCPCVQNNSQNGLPLHSSALKTTKGTKEVKAILISIIYHSPVFRSVGWRSLEVATRYYASWSHLE